MRRLAPRDKYLLTMDEEDNFKMLVVTKDFSRYYVAQSNGELVAGILDISVKTRKRFASGTIDSSLFASMQSYGLKPGFIVDFTDVFSWTVDFNTETREGDTFACYWQEDYTADGTTLNHLILGDLFIKLRCPEGFDFHGQLTFFCFSDHFFHQQTGRHTR
jgi:hypothetical protein